MHENVWRSILNWREEEKINADTIFTAWSTDKSFHALHIIEKKMSGYLVDACIIKPGSMNSIKRTSTFH
jgi:hypothetical protein